MRPTFQLILLWGLIGLAACDEGRLITVHVRGREVADIHSLKVEFAHRDPGRKEPSAWQGESLFHRLDQFSVKVNARLGGELAIRVGGLAQDGCRVAEGGTTVALDAPLTIEPGMDLVALAQPGCALLIENVGDGSGKVVIEPSGEVWDARSPRAIRLRPAELVTLRAQPEQGSYFIGWSGACRGATTCQVTISDQAARVGAGLLRRNVCVRGFCWENPLPQGSSLNALHVFSPNDAWAVGSNSTILHWNGSFWAPVPSGLTDQLYHLAGVWGAAPDDLWVVGSAGVLLHWDGASFARYQGGRQTGWSGVWGKSSTQVWVVGDGGAVLRWDGHLWTDAPSGTTEDLLAVGGSSATDLWMAGARGTLLHGDGQRLVRVETGTVALLNSIWDGGEETWIVGVDGQKGVLLRVGESGTTVTQAPTALLGVWGASPTDIYAVGRNGIILHWDGASWGLIDADMREFGSFYWLAVSGSGPDDVWLAAVDGSLRRWNGSFFSAVDSAPREGLSGVWANTETDVWAVGDEGIVLRSLGAGWVPVRGARGTGVHLFDVWAGGPGEVFAVGTTGAIFRFDGDRMRLVVHETAEDLYAVWGFRAGAGGRPQVWAVGRRGTIVRTDGVSVVVVASGTTSDLLGIWGSGPADLWAVGAQGTVLRYDGTVWARVASGTERNLYDVFGWQGREVWAVGDETVLRFGQGGLIGTPSTVQKMDLNAVWGSGPDDVWTAGVDQLGSRGPLLRWKGGSSIEAGWLSAPALYDVHGTAAGHLFAVGLRGMILHHAKAF